MTALLGATDEVRIELASPGVGAVCGLRVAEFLEGATHLEVGRRVGRPNGDGAAERVERGHGVAAFQSGTAERRPDPCFVFALGLAAQARPFGQVRAGTGVVARRAQHARQRVVHAGIGRAQFQRTTQGRGGAASVTA